MDDPADADLRLRLAAAWIDPQDETVWSRTLYSLTRELTSLGVYGGYYDATPWPVPTSLVHRWLERTHRSSGVWQLKIEMRMLTSLYNVWERMRTADSADTWILPPGVFGRPVSGRYATWGEITPSQLISAYPDYTASVGYPEMTPRGLRSLVRQSLRIYRRAPVCCVATSWAADSLVSDHGIDPARVKVVGYGRNLEVELPAERDWSVPRFLFVGADWHRKNGDAVVRAFQRLRPHAPHARLDIVGEHPRLDEPAVHGHGRLDASKPADREILEDLFRRATCFVLPSVLEAFGIVYVEAAAAGIASIGTTNGGTKTSIGEGGLLVDPRDDKAIVEAMQRLADPEQARAFGNRALERSSQFTWRKSAERLVRAVRPDIADARGFADFL